MKTTKQECIDAITYFHEMGMIENLSRDEAHYVDVLTKRVAQLYGIVLF
jgi:hypothetical protein